MVIQKYKIHETDEKIGGKLLAISVKVSPNTQGYIWSQCSKKLIDPQSSLSLVLQKNH
jgi:hypothetical protein